MLYMCIPSRLPCPCYSMLAKPALLNAVRYCSNDPCPLSFFVKGEIFAAEGYAKTTGRVGVCIATSGPGATNLVTGLADAMMDSVPLVAITGQVWHNWSVLGVIQCT
eukprot:GHUV01017504.1.p1 GENE.GHUV01017504.1~~GHUV01017504.1.p1  ORF type:complete len:107 (-),score=7.74 GHUV01017504.1:658-978(-)